MAFADLRRLWALHEIDEAMAEIKTQAARLDGGKKLQAERDALHQKYAPVLARAKSLLGEQTDLELRSVGLAERLDRIETELYSGGLMPRDIAFREKEKESLIKQRDEIDNELLTVMEALPKAQEDAKKVEAALAQRDAMIAKEKSNFKPRAEALQKSFNELQDKRKAAVALVPAALLTRYDAAKSKKGSGMAKVEGHSCGGCGMNLPEQTMIGLKEEKVQVCETCRRVLYYTEGLV